MSTWKFPDVLGGEEHDEHERVSGGTEAPIGTVAFHINGCLVCVAIALLTEVKPTLPPEPTELGWYLATIGDDETIARKVQPEGWSIGRGRFLSTWKTVNKDFPGITMRLLVPAPPVVELPWTSGPEDTELGYAKVYRRGDRVRVVAYEGEEIAGVWVNAKQMIAALTAADEAKRRTDV